MPCHRTAEKGAVAQSYLGNHLQAGQSLQAALAMAAGASPQQKPADITAAFDFKQQAAVGGPWDEFDASIAKERRRQILFLAAVLATRARLPQVARQYVAMVPNEVSGTPRLLRYVTRLETNGRQGEPILGPEEGYQAANRDFWPLASDNELDDLLSLFAERSYLGQGLVPWIVGDWSRPKLTKWFLKDSPPFDATGGFHALLSDTAARRELAQALVRRPWRHGLSLLLGDNGRPGWTAARQSSCRHGRASLAAKRVAELCLVVATYNRTMVVELLAKHA